MSAEDTASQISVISVYSMTYKKPSFWGSCFPRWCRDIS